MPEYARTAAVRHDTPRVKLSAMQPTSELVDALYRAEAHIDDPRWHEGWQVILRAVVSLLADQGAAADLSGQGQMTQQQVANRAHRSLRTAQRWWPILQELRLITWTRGVPGPGEYQARPGVVRVNKKRVIRLVGMLRRAKDRAVADQRRATRARLLADIRSARALWVRCLRRSAIPATTSGLPLDREGSPPSRGGGAPARVPVWDVGPECEHGGIVGRCPSCRRRQDGRPSGAALTMNAVPVDLFGMPN